MGLQKQIEGRSAALVDYHMIPGGKLVKDVKNNTYNVEFELNRGTTWVEVVRPEIEIEY